MADALRNARRAPAGGRPVGRQPVGARLSWRRRVCSRMLRQCAGRDRRRRRCSRSRRWLAMCVRGAAGWAGCVVRRNWMRSARAVAAADRAMLACALVIYSGPAAVHGAHAREPAGPAGVPGIADWTHVCGACMGCRAAALLVESCYLSERCWCSRASLRITARKNRRSAPRFRYYLFSAPFWAGLARFGALDVAACRDAFVALEQDLGDAGALGPAAWARLDDGDSRMPLPVLSLRSLGLVFLRAVQHQQLADMLHRRGVELCRRSVRRSRRALRGRRRTRGP